MITHHDRCSLEVHTYDIRTFWYNVIMTRATGFYVGSPSTRVFFSAPIGVLVNRLSCETRHVTRARRKTRNDFLPDRAAAAAAGRRTVPRESVPRGSDTDSPTATDVRTRGPSVRVRRVSVSLVFRVDERIEGPRSCTRQALYIYYCATGA